MTTINEAKMEKSEAKELLIYLLHQLEKICEYGNIPYYAYAGTLLGAVRHQGIIPWDDDIDVVVPRMYYASFVKACSEVLKKPVTIRSRENDPYFCQEYIKICFEDDVLGFSDLSIDIFFLDDTDPQRKILRAIQNKLVKGLYPVKLYKISREGRADYIPKNPLKRIAVAAVSLLPYKTLDKMLYKGMTAEKKKTDYYVNWGSHYSYKKVTFKKSDWGKPQKIRFENTMINAPEHIEATLIPIYGPDYMTPPSPEKQVDHGIRKLNCVALNIEEVRKANAKEIDI